MLPVLDIATPLQIVALLIFLLDAGLWLVLYKDKRFDSIKPILLLQLSYLINIIVFYIVLLIVDIWNLDKINPNFSSIMMGWSTGIRIHLGIILAITFIAAVYWRKLLSWIQSR